MNVSDVTKRQPVERWYTATPVSTSNKHGKDTKADVPLIRVKARYQNVQILPMILYQPLVSVSYLPALLMGNIVLFVNDWGLEYLHHWYLKRVVKK